MTDIRSAASAPPERPRVLHLGTTQPPSSMNLGLKPGRSIDCPRCHRATTVVALGNIELDVCSVGCGVWFDRGEIAGLRDGASEASLRQAVRSILGKLKTPAKAQAMEYLGCPCCSERMTRRYFKHRSAITLNQCPAHGSWLSQEDALCLIAALASGAEEPGLDALEVEPTKTSLRPRIQHLESLINARRPSKEGPALQERMDVALGTLEMV